MFKDLKDTYISASGIVYPKFGQKVALKKCGPFRQEGNQEVCNACHARWTLRPGIGPRDYHDWYEIAKPMPEESHGITMPAAKYIFKMCAEHFNKTDTLLDKTPTELAEEHDLWMADCWTHLGYTIVTCLESPKLVEAYLKGNAKVLDSLLGKTIKSANMTVDPEYIKELIPLVIDKWFK
jgi:hypothetical protein